MSEGLIPQRYAKALYKLAEEKGETKEVYQEMKTLAESFAANPELQKVLSNPFVKREDKAKLLITAAGESVGDDYRSFVELILNRDRSEFAYMMALAYCNLYRKANNIAIVKIITAAKLDDNQLKKIREIVSKAYPEKKLEISYSVNPDLIGGFVVDIEDQRLDASIKNEIEQIRLNLLRSN